MNGKEYLSAFSAFHEKDAAYYDALLMGQNLTPQAAVGYLRGDEQLDTLLGSIYFEEDVTDDTTSPEELEQSKALVRSLCSVGKLYREAGRQALERSGMCRTNAFGLSDFTAEWMSSADLVERIETDRETLSGMGKLHGTDVFGRTLLNLETRQFAGKPAEAIKEAMGHHRRDLFQSLATYNRIITVERAYYNGSGGHQDGQPHPQLEFGVTVQQAGKLLPPPKWLVESSAWDSPLHRLCAVLSEFDTYIALQEWVQDRKLPYIPVIAPRSIEDGTYHYRPQGDKNYHADLLLLDVTSNNIIPIQVKHRASAVEREKYFDGMAFVDPKLLGLQAYSHKPVQLPSGITATGDVVATSHGQILSAWLNLAATKAPKKVDKLAFRKLLEPAFMLFDAILEADKRAAVVQIPEQKTVDSSHEKLSISA